MITTTSVFKSVRVDLGRAALFHQGCTLQVTNRQDCLLQIIRWYRSTCRFKYMT